MSKVSSSHSNIPLRPLRTGRGERERGKGGGGSALHPQASSAFGNCSSKPERVRAANKMNAVQFDFLPHFNISFNWLHVLYSSGPIYYSIC